MSDYYLQKLTREEARDRSEQIWAAHLAELGTPLQQTRYAVDFDVIDDGDDEAKRTVAETTLVFPQEYYDKFRDYLSEDEKITVTTERPADKTDTQTGGGGGNGRARMRFARRR